GYDLRFALEGLGLGEELVLDYRGEHDAAPRFVVRRSANDVFTAEEGSDGSLEPAGDTEWVWPPSMSKGDRLGQIGFELLSRLKELRGARGVILVEPLR